MAQPPHEIVFTIGVSTPTDITTSLGPASSVEVSSEGTVLRYKSYKWSYPKIYLVYLDQSTIPINTFGITFAFNNQNKLFRVSQSRP
jgi:hypothetical protein